MKSWVRVPVFRLDELHLLVFRYHFGYFGKGGAEWIGANRTWLISLVVLILS